VTAHARADRGGLVGPLSRDAIERDGELAKV
jgi:hypothetical protein